MMSIAQVEKAFSEVEKNREQVLRLFMQLKDQLNSSIMGVKSLKKAATEESDSATDVLKNPTAVLIEFFILGFYSGKMIKSLRQSTRL